MFSFLLYEPSFFPHFFFSTNADTDIFQVVLANWAPFNKEEKQNLV